MLKCTKLVSYLKKNHYLMTNTAKKIKNIGVKRYWFLKVMIIYLYKGWELCQGEMRFPPDDLARYRIPAIMFTCTKVGNCARER